MEYQKSIFDIIRQRSSWRTYSKEPLSESLQKQLKTYCEQQQQGPFGNKARFHLIDKKTSFDSGEKIGTYGIIQGAQSYLVGAIMNGPHNIEDYGFLFEKIILYATDLELGTCWLGGTFSKSAFANAIDLSPDEVLPAVSPVGYLPMQRSLVGKIMRLFVKAQNRKPWADLFFEGGFDKVLSTSNAGKYEEVLEMIRLGPSAQNKQSWRIVKDIDRDKFHFYIQIPSNSTSVYNYQRLDIGIAMCHFELSALELTIKGHWEEIQEKIEHKIEKLIYIISWICDN